MPQSSHLDSPGLSSAEDHGELPAARLAGPAIADADARQLLGRVYRESLIPPRFPQRTLVTAFARSFTLPKEGTEQENRPRHPTPGCSATLHTASTLGTSLTTAGA